MLVRNHRSINEMSSTLYWYNHQLPYKTCQKRVQLDTDDVYILYFKSLNATSSLLYLIVFYLETFPICLFELILESYEFSIFQGFDVERIQDEIYFMGPKDVGYRRLDSETYKNLISNLQLAKL